MTAMISQVYKVASVYLYSVRGTYVNSPSIFAWVSPLFFPVLLFIFLFVYFFRKPRFLAIVFQKNFLPRYFILFCRSFPVDFSFICIIIFFPLFPHSFPIAPNLSKLTKHETSSFTQNTMTLFLYVENSPPRTPTPITRSHQSLFLQSKFIFTRRFAQRSIRERSDFYIADAGLQ